MSYEWPQTLQMRIVLHVRDIMLEKYHKLHSKPKTTDELKVALQTIWEELPQEHINKAVANFIDA